MRFEYQDFNWVGIISINHKPEKLIDIYRALYDITTI